MQGFEAICEIEKLALEADSGARQEWWTKMSYLLMVHARDLAHGTNLTPKPAIQIARMANVCEELGNGNAPDLVTDAIDNKRKYWRIERRYLTWAATYIAFCKAGKITDRASTKTVREAYGVSTQAVQKSG